MGTFLDPNDRRDTLARLSNLQPDSPRQWGRMSPHGMLCHLGDSFDACSGDRPGPDISTLMSRTAMRLVGITLPVPWPKGVPTLPEVDQEKQGTAPGDFREDLKRVLEISDSFMDRLDPATMRHPLFGRLTRAEWGRWAYRHVDHHTRQFGL